MKYYYSLFEDDEGYSYIGSISDDPSVFEDSDMVFVKDSLPIISGDFGIDLQTHTPYQGKFDSSLFIITDSDDDRWADNSESPQYRVQIYRDGILIDDFYE